MSDENNVIPFRLRDRFGKACYSADFPDPKFFADLEDDSDRLAEKLVEALNAFIEEEGITPDAACVGAGVGKFADCIAELGDQDHRSCILAHLEVVEETEAEKEEAAVIMALHSELDGEPKHVRNISLDWSLIDGVKVCAVSFTIEGKPQDHVFVVTPSADVSVAKAPEDIASRARLRAARPTAVNQTGG